VKYFFQHKYKNILQVEISWNCSKTSRLYIHKNTSICNVVTQSLEGWNQIPKHGENDYCTVMYICNTCLTERNCDFQAEQKIARRITSKVVPMWFWWPKLLRKNLQESFFLTTNLIYLNIWFLSTHRPVFLNGFSRQQKSSHLANSGGHRALVFLYKKMPSQFSQTIEIFVDTRRRNFLKSSGYPLLYTQLETHYLNFYFWKTYLPRLKINGTDAISAVEQYTKSAKKEELILRSANPYDHFIYN
jgi:hypothetical protein